MIEDAEQAEQRFGVTSAPIRMGKRRSDTAIVLLALAALCLLAGALGATTLAYSFGRRASSLTFIGGFAAIAVCAIGITIFFTVVVRLRSRVPAEIVVASSRVEIRDETEVLSSLTWSSPRFRLVFTTVSDPENPSVSRVFARFPGVPNVGIPREAFVAIVGRASSPTSRLEIRKARTVLGLDRVIISARS
jgi:hypothetical protein